MNFEGNGEWKKRRDREGKGGEGVEVVGKVRKCVGGRMGLESGSCGMKKKK